MRKKKLQKIMKNVLILAGIYLFCLSFRGVTAMAATGPAYDFTFEFPSSRCMVWTELENKTSADFLSMQCTWAEYEDSFYDAWASNYNGDCGGKMQRFYLGTWHLLGNTIYENGYSMAMVNGMVLPGYGIPQSGGDFGGYWYADSGIQ